jgi:hypothetical protein
MTAKGKINASKVQAGDRILVHVSDISGHVSISHTKTGEGVQVARVIRKTAEMVPGYRRSQRLHVIHTSAGEFKAVGIETMWLAPEDAAGIKRAHAEAMLEYSERQTTEREEARREALDKSTDLSNPANRPGHVAPPAETEEPSMRQIRQELRAEGFELMGRMDRQIREIYADEELRAKYRADLLTLHSHDGKVDPDSEDDDTEEPEMTATTETQTETQTGCQTCAVTIAGEACFGCGTVQPTETAPTTDRTGSAVVQLLEKVWARIREDHPELPEVVIVTGSGLVGGSKWGHFRADGWKVREGASVSLRMHEMFMAGETLAKGANQVLQTMLHEGAHTLAKVRDLKDTSRQGRWHNATFRTLAAEMGLEHKGTSADSSHGFSFVTLTETTKARYADLLAELAAEIRLMCDLPLWLSGDADEDGEDRGGEKITGKPKTGETKPQSGLLKATCVCLEPNIIRLSQKVLDLEVVRCDRCANLFRV